MKNNTLLYIIIFLTLASCSPKFSSDYYHDFYQARQEQMIHLVDGERAPLTAEDLKHIVYHPYKNEYRVTANFTKSPKIEVFEMATYSGQTKEFAKIGRLTFSLQNKTNHIHVYQSVRYANHPIYGLYYFIPFKDLTSGEESYGGGRYIDIKKSLFESNKVVLDFNQTYNPWCAYSDGYNCPIPPAENNLNIAIQAGEQVFAKTKEH